MRSSTVPFLCSILVRLVAATAVVPCLGVGCGIPTDAARTDGRQVIDPTGLAHTKQPVIYGTDDRADVYAHASSELRTLATQSTVALFLPGELDERNPTAIRVTARSLAN